MEDSQRPCLGQLIRHGSNPYPSGHGCNDQEQQISQSSCPEHNTPLRQVFRRRRHRRCGEWDLESQQQQKRGNLAGKISDVHKEAHAMKALPCDIVANCKQHYQQPCTPAALHPISGRRRRFYVCPARRASRVCAMAHYNAEAQHPRKSTGMQRDNIGNIHSLLIQYKSPQWNSFQIDPRI